MATQNRSAEWRVIQSFPDYEVSDQGVIRRRVPHSRLKNSLPAGHIVPQWVLRTPFKRRDGSKLIKQYKAVSLYDAEKRIKKNVLVNRIVCEAFHGPAPTERHQAAHNNGYSFDNRAGNLRWASPEENQADRTEHGTHNKGSRHGMSRITETDVIAIISRLMAGEDEASIAAVYGVGRTTVTRIRLGTTWEHVKRPEGFDAIQEPRRNPMTEQDAITALTRMEAGESPIALAKEYGTTKRAMYSLRRGATWPHMKRSGDSVRAIAETLLPKVAGKGA